MGATHRFNMIKKINLITLVAALAAGHAFAQSAPTAPKDSGWITTAGFGLSISKGNTDNELYTGNLLTSRKWGANEADLGVDGQYGETSGAQNTGNARGFGQYNRLFNERLFGYVRLEVQHDSIADLDYRVTLSPGLGYYVIKNTNTFLRFEAGPGFVHEKLGGQEDDYMTLRLAERFEHKLNDRVRLWQSLEYLPDVSEFENYIVNAEIGIDASLTDKLSLRTYLQDTYDSQPAPGRDKNDLKLVAAIAYKF